MNSRNQTIDILRVLGTFLVILAHVNAPAFLINLRSFDVVMLVFLSGLTLGSKRTNIGYINYVKKRFKRLIVPLYKILFILLLITTFFYLQGTITESLSFKNLFLAFLIYDSISFIWIVRVYFVIAITLPILISVYYKSTTKTFWVITLITFIGVQVYFSLDLYSKLNIINMYFFDIVPYIYIAMIGVIYERMNFKEKIILFIITLSCAFLIVVVLVSKSILIYPDNFKYPPQLLYVFYGLIMAISLFELVEFIKRRIENFGNSRILRWLSINSFNIYLFHIIIIYGMNFAINSGIIELNNFLYKYIFICIISILVTWIYNYLRKYIKYI
jgi:peptidoglycan/LPS O-acetylase OafA/YrhL